MSDHHGESKGHVHGPNCKHSHQQDVFQPQNKNSYGQYHGHEHENNNNGDEQGHVHTPECKHDGQSKKATLKREELHQLLQRAFEQEKMAGINDIWSAAKIGSYDSVMQFLDTDPSLLNKLDKDGRSPLHVAALGGHKDIVTELLERGADINIVNHNRFTPLHWAVVAGYISTVHFLISKGADINMRDIKGRNILHLAAENDHLDIVYYLIEIQKMVVDDLDIDDHTPLTWAAYKGSKSVVNFLLNRGANPNLQDKKGYTPLHWAAKSGHSETVVVFIENRADTQIRCNNGCTPLDLARNSGQETIVKTFDYLEKLHFLPKLLNSKEKKEQFRFFIGVILTVIYNITFIYASTYWWLIFVFVFAYFGGRYYFNLGNSFNGFPDGKYTTIWGILVATFFVEFFLYFYLLPESGFGKLFKVFFGIYFVIYVSSIFICSVVKPGFIGTKRDVENERFLKSIEAGEEFVVDSLCLTCAIIKPLRSKHCSQCGVCVSRMDHHCPWINNCVGFDNHIHFIIFLILGSTFCPLYTVYITEIIYTKMPAGIAFYNWIWHINPVHLKLFWESIAFSLFQSFLLYFQSVLISSNLTTNEDYNKQKYAQFKDKDTGKFSNPYSKGGRFQNIIEFVKRQTDWSNAYQNQNFKVS
jgi:palmitoyltransferase